MRLPIVARTDSFDCGIMISASYNPYYNNGIKLINDNGKKAEKSVIALVAPYIDGELYCFNHKWDVERLNHCGARGTESRPVICALGQKILRLQAGDSISHNTRDTLFKILKYDGSDIIDFK